VFLVQRAQLDQELGPVPDRAPVRRIDKGKLGDVTEAQRGHLEDDRGEVGTQDLRLGEPRAGDEVLFLVEPDADPVRDPATPSGPLIGRGLGDRLDRQPLHLEPVAVPGHPRGTGVDHVPDPRYRQRRLRHVGGQHDPPPGVRREDPVLFGR
jgi:hypothetical protein